MTQQFYVSPEQVMKDRADFARKGIARGKSVVVVTCEDGIALVAENLSRSLHKIGEIYDKIGFAAVGKYNEFESLRQAGVRYADVRGYSYDRDDVTARGLASVYAQSLGAVFTAEQKPFEVELAVAEVGATQAGDHIYRLTFDGSIADEHGFLAMGGQADAVQARLLEHWRPGAPLAVALSWAVVALDAPRQAGGLAGALAPEMLEVAVLERDTPARRGTHRAFRRLADDEVAALLATGAGTDTAVGQGGE
ncbi:proteasome subunit alpha [Specibacter cremeus]|uniref:proteasome subunit alpha n=1 Tax=Specibacter cremeus TaxID=1629051 RepID=UPI000F7912DA|nr:proteasome subunit alpha [Specibacter cremeus]